MRAVLDVNVIISAILSPAGRPAEVLRRWLEGSVELVVSPMLLDELARALAYKKLAARVTDDERNELVLLLRRAATLVDDPGTPSPVRSADPDDDYVIALAAAQGALIVSGDRHLTDLADEIPVFTPAQLLDHLDRER